VLQPPAKRKKRERREKGEAGEKRVEKREQERRENWPLNAGAKWRSGETTLEPDVSFESNHLSDPTPRP
jgi:hypothetical protein